MNETLAWNKGAANDVLWSKLLFTKLLERYDFGQCPVYQVSMSLKKYKFNQSFLYRIFMLLFF